MSSSVASIGDVVLPQIIVTIPARAEFLHIVRSVAASVAARLDFPYDGIDELRLVVDEACSLLLGLPSLGRDLTVGVSPGDGAVNVTVCVEAEPPAWPPERVEEGLTWQVLNGLADDAAFERWDGRPAVRLSKHVAKETG